MTVQITAACRPHLAQGGVDGAQAIVGLEQQQQRPGDAPEQAADLAAELRSVAAQLLPPCGVRGQPQVVQGGPNQATLQRAR